MLKLYVNISSYLNHQDLLWYTCKSFKLTTGRQSLPCAVLLLQPGFEPCWSTLTTPYMHSSPTSKEECNNAKDWVDGKGEHWGDRAGDDEGCDGGRVQGDLGLDNHGGLGLGLLPPPVTVIGHVLLAPAAILVRHVGAAVTHTHTLHCQQQHTHLKVYIQRWGRACVQL